MSILYICDRCGYRSKDSDKLRSVSLCEDHPNFDQDYQRRRIRIGAPESIRMLCPSCVSQVQATITEQLPLDAGDR